MSEEDLVLVIRNLKNSGITHLNLSGNKLGQHSALKKILEVLSDSGITHLDLSDNVLGLKSEADLISILSVLKHSGITNLDLSKNGLAQKTGLELINIFGALSESGITHLNLNGNGFERTPETELVTIFKAIPPNILTVSFTLRDLQKMSPEQRQAIQQRFPNAEQIVIIDDEDNNRILDADKIKTDAHIYRRLGFNFTPPSLLKTVSFFIAQNRDRFDPEIETNLPQEMKEYLNQF